MITPNNHRWITRSSQSTFQDPSCRSLGIPHQPSITRFQYRLSGHQWNTTSSPPPFGTIAVIPWIISILHRSSLLRQEHQLSLLPLGLLRLQLWIISTFINRHSLTGVSIVSTAFRIIAAIPLDYRYFIKLPTAIPSTTSSGRLGILYHPYGSTGLLLLYLGLLNSFL